MPEDALVNTILLSLYYQDIATAAATVLPHLSSPQACDVTSLLTERKAAFRIFHENNNNNNQTKTNPKLHNRTKHCKMISPYLLQPSPST